MTFRAAELPFFDGVGPRIFAHRGLHTAAPENTHGSFAAAVAAGVTYIETDIVASRDGVAMVAHDLVLDRVAGIPGLVSDRSAAELADIDLGGEGFITLEHALDAFPATRFNIDVKDAGAVDGLARAIASTGAKDRVLVSSFSSRRRRTALRQLPAVATSATASEFLAIFAAARVGFTPYVSDQHAVQIPVRIGPISTVSRKLVERYHAAGLEVHVWTVNDETKMRQLVDMGVDGIVTDRADVAITVLGS